MKASSRSIPSPSSSFTMGCDIVTDRGKEGRRTWPSPRVSECKDGRGELVFPEDLADARRTAAGRGPRA